VSASLNPSSVIIAGASSPGMLSQAVTLSLTTTSSCQTVSTQFDPGSSPVQSVTLSGSAPNYTTVLVPSLLWDTGLRAFTFTDVTGGNVALRNEQSVNLNVSLQCAVTVTLNPSPVKHTGSSLKSNVIVTAAPASGADCSGMTVTYSYSGGSSTQTMMLQSSGVYQYTINANANTWTVGTYPMTFASTNNPVVGTGGPIYLVVN
jgi:hypothetical protein